MTENNIRVGSSVAEHLTVTQETVVQFHSNPPMLCGAVAQFGRAPVLQAGCCGFKSHRLHHTEWLRLATQADCKSVPERAWWFNSTSLHQCPGDGTGIHTWLRPKVLGVRLSPRIPIGALV